MALDLTVIHVGSGILTLDPAGPNPITVEATQEGATLAYSRSMQFVEIDEAIGPVDAYIDGEECTFSVVCNELTAQKLKAAFGHGTITTVAPGAGQKGSDTLDFGGDPTVTEHVLEYRVKRRHNPNLEIVITLHRVVSVSEVESQFTKANPTGIQLSFRALADVSKPAGQRLGSIKIETAEAQ